VGHRKRSNRPRTRTRSAKIARSLRTGHCPADWLQEALHRAAFLLTLLYDAGDEFGPIHGLSRSALEFKRRLLSLADEVHVLIQDDEAYERSYEADQHDSQQDRLRHDLCRRIYRLVSAVDGAYFAIDPYAEQRVRSYEWLGEVNEHLVQHVKRLRLYHPDPATRRPTEPPAS